MHRAFEPVLRVSVRMPFRCGKNSSEGEQQVWRVVTTCNGQRPSDETVAAIVRLAQAGKLTPGRN